MHKINKLYLLLSIFIVASSLTGYLSFRSADAIPGGALHEMFGIDMLDSTQHALLDSLVCRFDQNEQSEASGFVLKNSNSYRWIFQSLLRHGMYLRYIDEADSVKTILGNAQIIAEFFHKELGESVLIQEFIFCDSLRGELLHTKLKTEWLYLTGRNHFGDYDSGMRYFNQSIALCKQTGDSIRWADNLNMIQYLQCNFSHYDLALTTGRRIIEITGPINYKRREASAHYVNGMIYNELGEANSALEILRPGLVIARVLNDFKTQMQILGKIANANRRLGRFSQALLAYNEALDLCEKFSDKEENFRLLSDRAVLLDKSGKYYRAKKDYNRALKLAIEINDSTNKAIIMLNLGELSRRLYELDEALTYLKNALNVLPTDAGYYDKARILEGKGSVHQDRKEYQLARKDFITATEIINQATEDQGDSKPLLLEGKLQMNIADLDKFDRNWQSAFEKYARALAIFEEIENPISIAHTRTRLGDALRTRGFYEQALIHLKSGLHVAKDIGDPLLISDNYYVTALVFEELGETSLAEENLRSAIAQVEIHRKEIAADERSNKDSDLQDLVDEMTLKINYFATGQDIYEKMILIQIQKQIHAAAFGYSEKSRARTLDELMRDKNFDTASATTDTTILSILPAIQHSFDENVQIIEYKVTEGSLVIFVVNRDSIQVTTNPISKSSLRNLISNFRIQIGADEYSKFVEQIRKNPQAAYQHAMRLASELYNILIQPIEEKISSNKTIYIIPDDILFYLPFSALVSLNGERERFLIEDYAIAYAPSATILKYIFETRKPELSAENMKLLAIGNPTGDLPGSEQEVKAIAKLIANSQLMVGSQVSEEVLSKALKENVHILHIACHAKINENEPLSSYLLLQKVQDMNGWNLMNGNAKSHSTFDGLLHTYEVFDLDLAQLRIVNLAGCHTAGGRLYRGEGNVGMSLSFMSAGASSVMNSLWNVNDEYTERSMKAFYGNWLLKKMNMAEALRQAQLQIIAEMRLDSVLANLPHPYLWAPFILTGGY